MLLSFAKAGEPNAAEALGESTGSPQGAAEEDSSNYSLSHGGKEPNWVVQGVGNDKWDMGDWVLSGSEWEPGAFYS